jgi:CBS domain-containing protein
MDDLPTARVAELMRRRFIQLRAGDTLLEAERLMRMARVRLLPVVEDGLLAGVLSHRRLLASSLAADGAGPAAGSCARWLRERSVGSLMDRRPQVVTPETPLRVAVERMLEGSEGSEGCLPVVAEGVELRRLVGILTENDLLRAAYASAPRH